MFSVHQDGGNAVRCGRFGTIQCASDDGAVCKNVSRGKVAPAISLVAFVPTSLNLTHPPVLSNWPGSLAAWEAMGGITAAHPITRACGAIRSANGADACEHLSCGNFNTKLMGCFRDEGMSVPGIPGLGFASAFAGGSVDVQNVPEPNKPVTNCALHCAGKRYMAVQSGSLCFCGDTFLAYERVPSSECNEPCEEPLYPNGCGGNQGNSVYRLTGDPAIFAAENETCPADFVPLQDFEQCMSGLFVEGSQYQGTWQEPACEAGWPGPGCFELGGLLYYSNCPSGPASRPLHRGVCYKASDHGVAASSLHGRPTLIPWSDVELGSPVYSDIESRNHTFASFGSGYPSSCFYVRASNNKTLPASEVFLTLNTSYRSTVYLDFFMRTNLEWGFQDWPDRAEWQLSPSRVGISAYVPGLVGPGAVYQRTFEPGSIELYGAAASTGNYLVTICREENFFEFDVLTGLGVWKGFHLFSLDIAKGDLRLQPDENIATVLDSSGTRQSLALELTLFAHYEWMPLGRGPVLAYTLPIEVRDNTCWLQQHGLKFGARSVLAPSSDMAVCKAKCRSRPQCSHIAVQSGTCYEYSQLCDEHGGCAYSGVSAQMRFPSCGERSICLDVQVGGYHYLSGEYCPNGENAKSGGLVYRKSGPTEQDSFWLQRDGQEGCEWVLKELSVFDQKDDAASYVELHGRQAACFRTPSPSSAYDSIGSFDLVHAAFTASPVSGQMDISGLAAYRPVGLPLGLPPQTLGPEVAATAPPTLSGSLSLHAGLRISRCLMQRRRMPLQMGPRARKCHQLCRTTLPLPFQTTTGFTPASVCLPPGTRKLLFLLRLGP